jgi:serine/threonine protein kinase
MQKGNKEKKTYWIMIMASCLTNLKDVYLDKTSALKEDNPGKSASDSTAHDDAKDSMVRYSIQMCSGLQYLHNKKLVHRDLKLENILVSKIYSFSVMCKLCRSFFVLLLLIIVFSVLL